MDLIGAMVAGAGSMILLGMAILLIYEAVAIATKRKLITYMVRDTIRERPSMSWILYGIIMLLIGHFLWH